MTCTFKCHRFLFSVFKMRAIFTFISGRQREVKWCGTPSALLLYTAQHARCLNTKTHIGFKFRASALSCGGLYKFESKG